MGTSLHAQPPFSVVDRSTFAVRYVDPEKGDRAGTAFCVPHQAYLLMTAQHTLGSGYWIEDWQKNVVKVKAQMFKGTDHKDIAVLMTEEPVCQLSANEWAPKNEMPSLRTMVLYGYGLGEKMYVPGTITGVPGAVDNFVIEGQFANLNAIGGHSGGPVYNPEGKIVGMLVGSATSLDVMDVIIPVEVLKKVVK